MIVAVVRSAKSPIRDSGFSYSVLIVEELGSVQESFKFFNEFYRFREVFALQVENENSEHAENSVTS